jgi:hypothetical protein
MKHGFFFAVDEIRAVPGPQAKAQNAKSATEQRRFVAIKLHTDRRVPRNCVQTAANVRDGILAHELPRALRCKMQTLHRGKSFPSGLQLPHDSSALNCYGEKFFMLLAISPWRIKGESLKE